MANVMRPEKIPLVKLFARLVRMPGKPVTSTETHHPQRDFTTEKLSTTFTVLFDNTNSE